MLLENAKIAIIGLGYVGLPLAVEFGKKRETLGFEINQSRVDELESGEDSTLECSPKELIEATHLSYTTETEQLKNCNVFIVTVPTPINEHKQPDLTPLEKASEMLGSVINQGDIIIYESTVYPGCSEEVCVPILEKVSGRTFNEDFYIGYSPERINPGDKEHRLPNIKKVTSGSTPECAKFVNELYQDIITAGTHLAPSIKVAEAAKVIENAQRDVNISLINELAKIFNMLDIDTLDVLEAAGTKWNFLPFRPGLVGGHCIGVDPYYLTYKAQSIGYNPEVILSGRRINDGMGEYVVSQLIKRMIKNKQQVNGSKVLLMGLTFKENCPDLRNTKVVDIISELEEYNINIDIYDPWVSKEEAIEEYGLSLIDEPTNDYEAVILAVAHNEFIDLGAEGVRKFLKKDGLLYDLKSLFEKSESDIRL